MKTVKNSSPRKLGKEDVRTLTGGSTLQRLTCLSSLKVVTEDKQASSLKVAKEVRKRFLVSGEIPHQRESFGEISM